MQQTVGEKGIVVEVEWPIPGASESDRFVPLAGLLVGQDKLVLRLPGGVIFCSLLQMRKDPRFKIRFFDFRTIEVPPHIVENVETRIERFAQMLSLDTIAFSQEEATLSLEDQVLHAAEGPSGFGLPSSGQEALSPEEGVAQVAPFFRGVGEELFRPNR